MQHKAVLSVVDELDNDALAPIVERALGMPGVQVLDWHATPLMGLGDAAVFRVAGHSQTRDGTMPWAVILKTFPAGAEDQATEANREWYAYKSGFLDTLAGPLLAAGCLGTDRRGHTLCVWLEVVEDEYRGAWPDERYALAARHLGMFNGAYLEQGSASAPDWQSKYWLRYWVQRHTAQVDLVKREQNNPYMLGRYPHDVSAYLFCIWDAQEEIFAALDRLPHAFCHYDAFRNNLFACRGVGGQEQTVAIDWAFAGSAALGEELSSLTVASAIFSGFDPSRLAELEKLVFPEYIAGLRDAGWQGDEEEVRLGYALATPLRFMMPTMIEPMLSDEGRTMVERAVGLPVAEMERRSVVTYHYLMGLAEEAQALVGRR